MSCLILPKEHIDVMCWAAAEFSNRLIDYPSGAIRLRHPDGSIERIQISSGRSCDEEGLTRLGQILTEGNYRSVNARYGEDAPVPVYRWEPPRSTDWSCEEVIRAVSCYEYQSCESPGWRDSAAAGACSAIREICVEGIVECAGARCGHGLAWEIGPETEPARADPAAAPGGAVTRADARAGRRGPFTFGDLDLIDAALSFPADPGNLAWTPGAEELLVRLADIHASVCEAVGAGGPTAGGEAAAVEAPYRPSGRSNEEERA